MSPTEAIGLGSVQTTPIGVWTRHHPVPFDAVSGHVVHLMPATHVTANYLGWPESGGAALGIDLLDRLVAALGTMTANLPPIFGTSCTSEVLKTIHELRYSWGA
jgi:hypothetical protein